MDVYTVIVLLCALSVGFMFGLWVEYIGGGK